MSEPEGRGAAWTEEGRARDERGATREGSALKRPGGERGQQSEPEGRGAAWTEEGRARDERGATTEGSALKRPGGERGQHSDPDPAGLLDLACSAAQEAARLLVSRRPPGPLGRPQVAETKSSPTDVVTEMDRSAEALIARLLLAERPGDAILGEEGGESGHGRVRWIVDPLDGTVNYLYGLPDWAVSIAAEVDGTVVAGVVAVPARGEVFTAVLGEGAWSRSAGQPPVAARCNAPVPLHQALVATGFGYTAARRAVQGEVVAAVLPRVRDIRRGGSCAVDLCSLAMGRVDAYYERGVNYWDFAAGGLVATEAGARLGGLNGKLANPELTIAAEPGLFGALHELLAGLDPERDAPC